jgi:hypothetical protein
MVFHKLPIKVNVNYRTPTARAARRSLQPQVRQIDALFLPERHRRAVARHPLAVAHQQALGQYLRFGELVKKLRGPSAVISSGFSKWNGCRRCP